MKVKRPIPKYLKSHEAELIQRAFIIAAWLIISLFIVGCTSTSNAPRQLMVHDMGSQVMPFDLGKTQHIFQMTESGGIQLVVVRNMKDTDQITFIRQHLMNETMRFQSGDFSDPASLHGATMSGISELSKGAAKIRIEYSEVPGGAQMAFQTDDIHLITAIHRWFGAQLSDHGSDASYR